MTLSDNPIGASYLYLLEPKIRFLEAAVEHLIPTDELGPGARDAGVVVYIDRALASTWGVHGRQYRGGPWLEGPPQQGYQSRFTPQEVYRIAIREINEHRNTEEGYFADPLYGGNRGKVGWKLLGFPGVPSGQYRELLTSHEPYHAEPVSVLDIQTGKVPLDAEGLPKHVVTTRSSSGER